jgi:hypothetical protein
MYIIIPAANPKDTANILGFAKLASTGKNTTAVIYLFLFFGQIRFDDSDDDDDDDDEKGKEGGIYVREGGGEQ